MASAHRPLARDERERRNIGSETAALRRVSERVASLRPCDWRSSEAGASLVSIWATAFTGKRVPRASVGALAVRLIRKPTARRGDAR